MLKLIVIALFVACVSSSVVPKPPSVTHGDVKHDTPMVKSTPIHHEHHPSSEKPLEKPAEAKTEVKHDEKAKHLSHHDLKSDEKKDQHQASTKKIEHHGNHPDNHAALKHHNVPVNVGHDDKVAHKPEKVEMVRAKASDHKH